MVLEQWPNGSRLVDSYDTRFHEFDESDDGRNEGDEVVGNALNSTTMSSALFRGPQSTSSASSQNNNSWGIFSSFINNVTKRSLPGGTHKENSTRRQCPPNQTKNESFALDEINSIQLMSLQHSDDNRISL